MLSAGVCSSQTGCKLMSAATQENMSERADVFQPLHKCSAY